MLFLEYPKCTTCQKAKKWLESKEVLFEHRHIVDQNPTEVELTKWIDQSGLEVKRFFNTSGLRYKALELKDKLPTMTKEEQIRLLASEGMLVKRPLIIKNDVILVGFKETEWREKLLK